MAEINCITLINDANLKGYYRFSSGALTTDSGTAGITLTNTNTVGENTGVFGGCADTGTANTNKRFSAANNYGLVWNGSATFSLWVKINTAPSLNSQMKLFDHVAQTGTAGYGWGCRYADVGGTKRVTFLTAGGGASYSTFDYTLTTGTWYQFACVDNGTSQFLYINSALQGAGSARDNTPYNYGGGTMSIFANNAGGGEFLSGQIDDFAVFNRALGTAEITKIYSGACDFLTAYNRLLTGVGQ